jgi:hypothetical protein
LKGPILRATKLSPILKGKSCHRRTLAWLWAGDVKHLTNFAGGNSCFCTSLSSCTPWSTIVLPSAGQGFVLHVLPFLTSFEPATSSEEELDYYLQTSFVCLQAAAVFKLFDLNFALTSIKMLQNTYVFFGAIFCENEKIKILKRVFCHNIPCFSEEKSPHFKKLIIHHIRTLFIIL